MHALGSQTALLRRADAMIAIDNAFDFFNVVLVFLVHVFLVQDSCPSTTGLSDFEHDPAEGTVLNQVT